MHVLTARRAIRATLALSVLLGSGLAAQGLTGQSSQAGVICGGQSCSIYLGAYIKLAGDYGPGGNSGITVPPPVCWYSPVSGTDPAEGGTPSAAVPFDKFVRAALKGNYGTWSLADGGGGGGGSSFFATIEGTADSAADYPHYTHPASGTWYGLDADGSAQGQRCVGTRPWLSWVATGALPPPPTVTPLTLALYAFKYMTLPAESVTLNPAGRSYVSLPTFVRLAIHTGVLANGDPYRWVIARIQGTGQVASVWAVAHPVVVNPGTPDATPYENCSPTGSRWSGQSMNSTGPNTRIDCGATYRDPSVAGSFNLTANTVWTATWAPVASQTPVGGAQAVPGGRLDSIAMHAVNVAEIQSLNN